MMENLNLQFEPILIKDGIVCFAPEYSQMDRGMDFHLLEKLYHIEGSYFWSVSRRKLIQDLFQKFVPDKNASVIELGAGTGSIAQSLSEQGYSDISVGEIHMDGLYFAKSQGIKKLFQINLLKLPFKESFDVVGLFDVLEHIEDHHLVLENVYQSLKKGGLLFLTVPAHQYLWNSYDDLMGHHRRYEIKNLKSVVEKHGFRALKSSYYFVSIFPLMMLKKIIQSHMRSKKSDASFSEHVHINPFINLILKAILWVENKLLLKVSSPLGSSIIMVLKK